MLGYSLPQPQSDFVDLKTGRVNRDWFLYLLNLFNSTGEGGASFNPDDLMMAIISASIPKSDVKSDVPVVARDVGLRDIERRVEQIEQAIRRPAARDRKIEEVEEFVALVAGRSPQLRTTSTRYPALTLIQQWAGSIATIPSGWALCDGSASTPDMRNLFVIGAGSTYAVGATGGSTTVVANNTPLLYTAGAASLSVTTSIAAPYLPPYYALAYITNTSDYLVINSVQIQG